MITPRKFAKETGLSYEQILNMCKSGEIKAIETKGGHYKIPDYVIQKYSPDANMVSIEEFNKAQAEILRLRNIITKLKNQVLSLDA